MLGTVTIFGVTADNTSKVTSVQKRTPPFPLSLNMVSIHACTFIILSAGRRDVQSETASSGSDACRGIQQCLSKELHLC